MACIYCNNEGYGEKFEITDIFGETYQFKQCSACSTFYMDPPPTERQLNQAYGDDYYGEGSSKFNPITQKVFNWVKKWSVTFFIKRLKSQDKMLDIGCGDGSFLNIMKSAADVETHGLEMEGESARRCSKHTHIQLKVSKFTHGLYQQNTFDVISIIHVFEHLPEPKAALLEIHRILKPGGHFLIEIPNINSLQFQWFKSHWFHLDPPRHLNMMHPNQLISDLSQMGLDCIDSSYHSFQFGPFGFQQSLLNAMGFKRDVLYEYLKRNKAYYKDYSKIGLFMMVLFHWFSFPIFVITDRVVSLFKKGAVVRLVFKKGLP